MATTRTGVPFEEHESDDDEDAIISDDFPEADEDDRYNVEKILLERYNEAQGRTEYLIKWEGWPLGESTYEPEENFGEHGEAILQEWRETQRRVKEGLEEPFTDEEFVAAREEWREKLKRKEERLERYGQAASASPDNGGGHDVEMHNAGAAQASSKSSRGSSAAAAAAPALSSSSASDSEDQEYNHSDSDSDDVLAEPAAPRETAVRRLGGTAKPSSQRLSSRPSAPIKKGVAQAVKKSNATKLVVSSSSSGNTSDDETSKSTDADSLLNELGQEATIAPKTTEAPKGVAAKAANVPKNTIAPVRRSTMQTPAKAPPQTKVQRSILKPHRTAPTKAKKVDSTPPASTVAGKSAPVRPVAPSIQPAKTKRPTTTVSSTPSKRTAPAPVNIFVKWNDPKQPRKRSRTESTSITDDFKNLSHRHRAHLKTAREAAPRPDAVPTVDPKTGRLVSTVQVPTVATMSDAVAEAVDELDLEPGLDSLFWPTVEPVREPVREPVQEQVQEPEREPVQEPVREPVQDPAQEPVQEPTQEPALEPVLEPTQESALEPAQELARDLVMNVDEQMQDLVQEPLFVPENEKEHEPALEPINQPVLEEAPEPLQESRHERRSEESATDRFLKPTPKPPPKQKQIEHPDGDLPVHQAEPGSSAKAHTDAHEKVIDPPSGRTVLIVPESESKSPEVRQPASAIESRYLGSPHAPTQSPVPSVRRARSPVQEHISRPAVERRKSEHEHNPQFTHKDRTPPCRYWLRGYCMLSAEACRFAHTMEPTMTCFFWHRGSCSKSAAECIWAHYDTGRVAPPPRGYSGTAGLAQQSPPHQQDADTKSSDGTPLPTVPRAKRFPGTTCYHWAHGDCWRTSETCDYAHFNTGVMGEPREAPSAKKCMTCYYWHNGGCTKPDDLCDYAHWETGIVAEPPGALKMRSRSSQSMSSRGRPTLTRLFRSQTAEQSSMDESPIESISAPASHVVHPTETNRDPMQPSAPSRTVLMTSIAEAPSTFTKARFALISIGKDTEEALDADLNFSRAEDVATFKSLVGTDCQLRFTHMIGVQDLLCFLTPSVNATQSILRGKVTALSDFHGVTRLREIVTSCQVQAAGLVSSSSTFTLVVCPKAFEDEPRIDFKSHTESENADLCCYLLPPSRHPIESAHWTPDGQQSLDAPAEEKRVIRSLGKLAGFDVNRILTIRGDRPLAKYAFLMIPQRYAKEHSIVSALLKMSDCKIYSSWTSGAWQYFRNTYRKSDVVVLIHRDVPLWKIPNLQSILAAGGMRFFTISSNPAEVLDTADSSLLSCERLFPNGEVVLVTDDAMVKTPDKAAAIIEYVMAVAKPKSGSAARQMKVATSPGIKATLMRLILDSTSKQGTPDPKLAKLYMSICDLCPPEAEDDWHIPSPKPSSLLVSVPSEYLPSYAPMWETDRKKATDYLVNWFAGWAISQASTFRRFTVCLEPEPSEYQMVVNEDGAMVPKPKPDPREWTKDYQHITVYTPDQFLKMKMGK